MKNKVEYDQCEWMPPEYLIPLYETRIGYVLIIWLLRIYLIFIEIPLELLAKLYEYIADKIKNRIS
jgi:hypothetical protein